MDSNRDTNLQDLHGTYEGQLLLANNDEISGWAIGPNIGKSALITILINGIAVTKVHADRVEYSPKNQSHNKPCGFRLSLHQSLIEKLPIANQVEARFPNGRKLDFGDQFVCALKGVQTADEDDLAKAMKSGRRLSSKSGMLLLPLEARPGWGALALQAHLQAEEIFKNETGRDLFVAYGTLLGLVRDGDLIAHDDDVDAMFMLEADNAYDAGQEFAKIADSLKNAGQNILNTFPGIGATVRRFPATCFRLPVMKMMCFQQSVKIYVELRFLCRQTQKNFCKECMGMVGRCQTLIFNGSRSKQL